VLGRLTGKPLEAPKKQVAPKKEKAASTSPEPAPQMMGAHGGEEKEIVGRSAAAIRARLEKKVDDVRYDDTRFRDLGVRIQSTSPCHAFPAVACPDCFALPLLLLPNQPTPRQASVRKGKQERLDALTNGRKGTGRDFLAMNLQPLSPQKKLAAIATRAAVEREKTIQIQNKKAIIEIETRARAEIQANRREVKKQREAAERRAAELRERQRQQLTVVALASRVTAFVKILSDYRAIDDEEKTKALSARMIQRCFRVFKWRKDTQHVRETRNAAARRVQRRVRNMLFRRRLEKRKAAASKIIYAVESITKSGTFPSLGKTLRCAL